MQNKEIIKYGLVLCGLVNIVGVLLATKFLTDFQVAQYQPIEISKFTLVMIVVWGFVFLTVAPKIELIPKLLLVFIVEKLAFGYVWANWLKNHYVLAKDMLENDFLSGSFQLIYGANDLCWAVFFIWGYLYLSQQRK